MLRVGLNYKRFFHFVSSYISKRPPREKMIVLFDVDGTLTLPMQTITDEFDIFLQEKIKPLATLALVGGSDFAKISKQLKGEDILKKYEHVFCENGLVYYKHGELMSKHSMNQFIGEEKSQTFINFCLRYLSEITLPVKRGNFVEFRTGMLNISPIGRSCNQEERNQFALYDKEHKVREKFVEAMKQAFPNSGLHFSLGGQISIDVFPEGWDKTFCLQYINEGSPPEEIHFFGDKTDAGGNDYEIYNHQRVHGHKVTSPDDTRRQLTELFSLK